MTPQQLIEAAGEALETYQGHNSEPGWLGFEGNQLIIYSFGCESPHFRRVVKLSREDISCGPTTRGWFDIGSKLFDYYKEKML